MAYPPLLHASAPPEPSGHNRDKVVTPGGGAGKSMTLWSITALGIGSMIGAGIFALMGQATLLAGKGVVLSFALAGVTALFSGYSYARLAVRYPTAGGILDYFNQGIPSAVLAGALSLMYLITLAVSTSMVAKTFGEYAAALLTEHVELSLPRTVLVNLFASCVIAGLTILNMVSAGAVGRAENVLVGVKLGILFLLMLTGLYTLDVHRIQLTPMKSAMPVLGSVGLTFFAFAGFGMMTNAAAETPNPEKTIPRAIFLAIGMVLIVYLGLAVVVLGNLLPAELVLYRDTAIARAARPVLGNAGFIIVGIAALLATASAINAMLFSSMRIARAMAEWGQLPAAFARPLWGEGSSGFFWSVAGVIVMTNILNLGAVANIASMTFLLCYLAVIICHWRLRRETRSHGVIILMGLACMVLVLCAFTVSLWNNGADALIFVAVFIALALGTEILLKRRRA